MIERRHRIRSDRAPLPEAVARGEAPGDVEIVRREREVARGSRAEEAQLDFRRSGRGVERQIKLGRDGARRGHVPIRDRSAETDQLRRDRFALRFALDMLPIAVKALVAAGQLDVAGTARGEPWRAAFHPLELIDNERCGLANLIAARGVVHRLCGAACIANRHAKKSRCATRSCTSPDHRIVVAGVVVPQARDAL